MQTSPLTHQTDLYSDEVHNAVWALYRALGAPTREPLVLDDGQVNTDNTGGFHPVFGLLTHSRAYDGFPPNGAHSAVDQPPGRYYRGDRLSIPAWSEDGTVGVVEMAFHKGATIFELLTFPSGAPEVGEALLDLLQKLETR